MSSCSYSRFMWLKTLNITINIDIRHEVLHACLAQSLGSTLFVTELWNGNKGLHSFVFKKPNLLFLRIVSFIVGLSLHMYTISMYVFCLFLILWSCSAAKCQVTFPQKERKKRKKEKKKVYSYRFIFQTSRDRTLKRVLLWKTMD